MSAFKVGTICVAAGSLLGLAFVLVVAKRTTSSVEPNCYQHMKKCNDTNQLYHLPSQQCLQNGESNGRICSNNMVITPLTTCRIQGECECDYENSERHLVYDDETDQCYPIYSQGPCEDGYVVTVSSNGKRLNCKRDICFKEKLNTVTAGKDLIVPYKNDCYTLSTELNEPGCQGKLKFWKNQMHPSCSPPPTHESFITGFAPLKCQRGSRHAFQGLCQPSSVLKAFRWNRLDATVDSDEELN